MTRLFPLILPDKPSPYGPATKSGESDDPDSETTDSEEISDSYEQGTESESDETTE